MRGAVALCCFLFFITLSVVHGGNTCSPSPLGVPSLTLGTSIYPNNSISYVSFTLSPYAASDFNISFYTMTYPYSNITVYTSWGNNSCPDQDENNAVSAGGVLKLSYNNPGVTTYYFGVQYTPGIPQNSSVWVVTILSVGCPNYCRGPGAVCDSQTGCSCFTNWYSPSSGCNVTGECDPFSNKTNPCVIPAFNDAGFGYQNCTFTDAAHSNWGVCEVAFCNQGYILDPVKNSCLSNATSTTAGTTGKDYVGPLTEAEFFGIIAGGVALVIIVIAVVVCCARRRRHHYHKIHHGHGYH